MRAHHSRRPRFAAAALCLLLLAATPAGALEMPDWEGTRAQEITSSTLDLLIVRPLATGRVIVGSLLFLPAALLSLPMEQEGFDGAFDTLIAEPSEYAFQRKIGEL